MSFDQVLACQGALVCMRMRTCVCQHTFQTVSWPDLRIQYEAEVRSSDRHIQNVMCWGVAHKAVLDQGSVAQSAVFTASDRQQRHLGASRHKGPAVEVNEWQVECAPCNITQLWVNVAARCAGADVV